MSVGGVLVVVVVDKWYWIVLEPVWGGVHCKGWFYCLLGGFGFGDKYHKFTTASTVYCTSLVVQYYTVLY